MKGDSMSIYGFFLKLIESFENEEDKTRCISAIRLHENAIKLINNKQLKKALSNEEKAIAEISVMPNSFPLRALCYANMGMIYLQLGEYPKSLVASRTAIPIFEANSIFKNEHATCLHAIGCALLGLKKAEESIQYFDRAINIWSSDPDQTQKIQVCRENMELARKILGSKCHDISGNIKRTGCLPIIVFCILAVCLTVCLLIKII